MMDFNMDLLQCFISFLIKKTSNWTVKMKLYLKKNYQNNYATQLLENLRKVHSSFIDNIWGADLTDMQLISKFNKGCPFLLSFIDIYSEDAWVIFLNAFQKPLDESKCKPNKIWVDKSREFYKRSTKLFLENIDIEIYLIHNEEKSVIAEKFTRTLKNKI